jgi:integrase
MQAKKPLTDRAIAAIKPAPPGKRLLVWDALVPGLGVRVTDKGQRSFVLVTRYPGSKNPAPRTIGKVGAIGLADARSVGQEWLRQIGQGIDPSQAAQAKAEGTFQAICTDYLARDGSKLRSAEWQRGQLARLVYPALGARQIGEIKRSDVVKLLDRAEEQSGPVMANRTLSIIRRVMNWHAARTDDYSSVIVRGMARAGEVRRDRVLSDDELRAVWAATGEGVFGAFVRFLLLTAARRNEALEMRWSEIAGDDWILPAERNKVAVELVRPLSGAAKAILAQRPRSGEFVFSRNGRAAMGGLSQLKAALNYDCGVEDWTLHDLRRTARTLMSRAGVLNDHAEQCLGHVLPNIRKTYDRHEYYEEKRIAYEKLAALIGQIVDPQPNIVSIRSGDQQVVNNPYAPL